MNWVGSGILFNAFDWDGAAPDTSAWTADGEPLAHPSNDAYPSDPDLRSAYETWLERTDEETLAAAEVPLADVEAPILLVSAGMDGVWPSRYLLARTEARLDAIDYGYRYEHVSYDRAGHGISLPGLPTWANRETELLGGTPGGTARAAVDSWPRAVEFFELGAGRG